MSDDHPRLDVEPLDTTTHDQTPDMSLDTSMSIREAATRVDVTEKTIRRWIKSGRLHAIKLGGQYRITIADLEQAREIDVQTVDVHHPDTRQVSPKVDTSTRPDIRHGQGRQDSESIDLTPLVNHIADLERQVGQLTETSTMWQIRAMQAEQRIEALTATIQEPEEPISEAVESPQSTAENANIETHRAHTDTSTAGFLARLRRWLHGSR